jgi:16S rRNA (uracil1498-N3)-methyltransferase
MRVTLLLPPEVLAGEEAMVEGDAYRHLFRSRRLSGGAVLRVADGKGNARWARVAQVERDRAVLVLGAAAPSNAPRRRLELLVAAPRRERASWLVEKAAELGVAAVRFLNTERAPRRYGRATWARFARVATAAIEQCHGARLPEISGMHPWSELPGLFGEGLESWYLEPGAAPPVRGWGRGPAALAVGPEGGWAASERRCLEELGARAVGLGPRVLRVETAAIAGASLLLLG